MSFVRPGESAPWLTNTLFQQQDEQGMMQEIVGQQSFADGASYSYSYAPGPDHDRQSEPGDRRRQLCRTTLGRQRPRSPMPGRCCTRPAIPAAPATRMVVPGRAAGRRHELGLPADAGAG